jgi:hypothetical protein
VFDIVSLDVFLMEEMAGLIPLSLGLLRAVAVNVISADEDMSLAAAAFIYELTLVGGDTLNTLLEGISPKDASAICRILGDSLEKYRERALAAANIVDVGPLLMVSSVLITLLAGFLHRDEDLLMRHSAVLKSVFTGCLSVALADRQGRMSATHAVHVTGLWSLLQRGCRAKELAIVFSECQAFALLVDCLKSGTASLGVSVALGAAVDIMTQLCVSCSELLKEPVKSCGLLTIAAELCLPIPSPTITKLLIVLSNLGHEHCSVIAEKAGILKALSADLLTLLTADTQQAYFDARTSSGLILNLLQTPTGQASCAQISYSLMAISENFCSKGRKMPAGTTHSLLSLLRLATVLLLREGRPDFERILVVLTKNCTLLAAASPDLLCIDMVRTCVDLIFAH